jgi:putative tryptophan/tyrosine transport system substrate-binding protein
VLEVSSLRAAAERLGPGVIDLTIGIPDELESAFQAAIREGATAIAAPSTALFSTRRSRIVALAAKYRLPAIYPIREYVDEGGLVAYGTNRRADFRHAAIVVDKILRGAKPAELPVEPTV